MSQILLVDDEPNFGAVLRDYLQMHSHQVQLCRDGQEGLQAFQNREFQLCILDVMMPRMDGFSLAKRIRAMDQHIPIIFLTAKSMKQDVHEGFKLGGDDYITKPFDSEELLYRIKAVLKRSAQKPAEILASQQEIFHIGSYIFNYKLHNLTYQDQTDRLSPKEAELLRLLCLRKDDLLSREEALLSLWGDDNYFNARSMDVFISKLRKRLRHAPTIKIENVHGKGFRLKVGGEIRK